MEDKELVRRAFRDLASLPAIQWLQITTAEAEEACTLGIETGLKGGDALVVQVARKYDIPLLTEDREIHQKAPPALQVLDAIDLLS